MSPERETRPIRTRTDDALEAVPAPVPSRPALAGLNPPALLALQRSAGNHRVARLPNGPTAQAEHAVVDPMITAIRDEAQRNAWPACGVQPDACP